jgi:hypothetical protein
MHVDSIIGARCKALFLVSMFLVVVFGAATDTICPADRTFSRGVRWAAAPAVLDRVLDF